MSNEQSAEKAKSFWTTLPGILTALSGLVVAITGLVTVMVNRDGQSNVELTPTSAEVAVIDEMPDPTETTAPPSETAAVIQPTDFPAPTEVLEHENIPDEPGKNPNWFVDASSLVFAIEGQATADDFLNMPLERPFTAESMDYAGYVDIIRAEISDTRTFTYVTVIVQETPPQDTVVYYGVEIDVDFDGRGDYLVYGLLPSGKEWTVEGVQVYMDGDDSVGGPTPIKSNPGIQGNGYEMLLFDSGTQTDDPDMAWIRRSPTNGSHIQLAFKTSLLDYTNKYFWSVWADAGPMQPGWFEYNDYFTLEEAGSPIRVAPEYPLKELALVDNTCRSPFGFKSAGTEPGVCP